MTFKVRFGSVEHAGGDEHRHIQHFEVRRAVGADARKGAEGAILATGETGGVVRSKNISVFAGLAPDLFAGDAVALRAFHMALAKENRFASEVWQRQMIGRGRIHAWASRHVLATVLSLSTPPK